MNKVKDYLTVPQAAKICSVDRTTMHRWVTAGKIKAYSTPGGHKRIQMKDFKFFFTENNIPIELDNLTKKKNKILIVDDDIGIQTYLITLLKSPFIDIKSASDGFEAGIKLISFKPDLIILDLSMPNMDGFEVCNYIKSTPELSKIKILVMTGHGTEENKEKVLSMGAEVFLTKPCPKNTIISHVEKLLGI